MITFLKRLASGVPTPGAGKVTLYVADDGVPGYKDEAGNAHTLKGEHGDAGTGTGTGAALPAGGTTGQVIRKRSGTDQDAGWETLAIADVADLQEALDSKEGGITSTDELTEGGRNLYYTDARVYEATKALLVAGNNVSITPKDQAREIEIAAVGAGGGTNRNTVNALLTTNGVVTIDCSLGDYFTLAPTEEVTSWVFTGVPAACAIAIVVTQPATAVSIAMPPATWPSGSAEAFSKGPGAIDELSLLTVNAGDTWHAVIAKGRA